MAAVKVYSVRFTPGRKRYQLVIERALGGLAILPFRSVAGAKSKTVSASTCCESSLITPDCQFISGRICEMKTPAAGKGKDGFHNGSARISNSR